MNILDFKEGQKYVPSKDLHSASMIVFKANVPYECLKGTTASDDDQRVLMRCEQPNETHFVVGWAAYFDPMIAPVKTDPDGELYDAYQTGTVTKEMLESYQQRHGKTQPLYMG